MKVKLLISSVFIFFIFLSFTHAQTPMGLEYLDTTFNAGSSVRGKVTQNFGTGIFAAKAMTTDLQSRIVVAACSANYVYAGRFLPSGIIDSTFGTNGKSTLYLPDYYVDITSMIRLSDGKFFLAGSIHNGTAQNILLIKLTQNGIPDSTWNSDGVAEYDLGTSMGDRATNIVEGSNGTIILVGSSDIKGACVRLRSDGTMDATFGTGGIVTWSTASVKDEASSLTLNGDTIYIAGQYEFASASANSSYTVLKLAPDGTQTGFGKVNFPGAGTRYTNTILLLSDGRIVVGGFTGSDYLVYRLRKDGTLDPTFGSGGISQINISAAGYNAYMTSMVFDSKDKKFILSGYGNLSSYQSFAVARLNFIGAPDNSFGNSGKIFINSTGNAYCASGKSLISSDSKLLQVGTENSSACILKINLRPVFVISGKDYVLPTTTETYEINVPSSWPYNYKWSFTGSNHYFVPDSIGSKVLLFFNSGATDGTLTCYAYLGVTVYATADLDIKINNNPSEANLLADVQCAKNVTDCYDNYISSFKFNLINNDSSTCNSTGYSDFTRSQWVDTLIAGSVYSAVVGTESSDPLKYAAIWIDYNNDGSFDSTSEFVSQTYTSGNTLNFQNIILKNKEGYTGPKRLRVRCNPYGFTSSQACQTAGELGETEDYMIIIKDQDNLEAPQIITPNDDGKNDFFVIRGVDPSAGNSLTIFDRYGEIIFTNDNYENSWSGLNKKGEKVTPGTYYYYFNNDENSIRGFIEVRY